MLPTHQFAGRLQVRLTLTIDRMIERLNAGAPDAVVSICGREARFVIASLSIDTGTRKTVLSGHLDAQELAMAGPDGMVRLDNGQVKIWLGRCRFWGGKIWDTPSEVTLACHRDVQTITSMLMSSGVSRETADNKDGIDWENYETPPDGLDPVEE